MRKRILQKTAHVLGVAALFNWAAFAQINTATVTGVVTDATHAIVPDAQIKITSSEMGVVKTAVSNTEGRYSFTFLLPGSYDLTVQAKGFGTFERKGLSV